MKELKEKKAVVLLSGGIDSAVCLAMARKQHKCYLLTFDYGQRHKREITRAASQKALCEEHKVVRICTTPMTTSGDYSRTAPSSLFGGTSLLGDGEVEKEEVPEGKIPSTWVPCRNLIFLALAASYAVSVDAKVIFIGVNVVDYSAYPDCRSIFIAAAELVIHEALGGTYTSKIRVHAPLMNLSKADIIRRGVELGVDFSLTHSCYSPTAGANGLVACGVCPSCRIRRKAFSEVGIPDPITYAGESNG